MSKPQTLTDQQQETVKADYRLWSGNLPPTETEIRRYVRYAMPADLPGAATARYLLTLMNEGWI